MRRRRETGFPRWRVLLAAFSIISVALIAFFPQSRPSIVENTENNTKLVLIPPNDNSESNFPNPLANYTKDDYTNIKIQMIKEIQWRNTLPNAERIAWWFNSLPIRHQEKFKKPYILGILLLVHKRPSYLRESIKLLQKVRKINETLLIISHDGLFEEVALEIQKIDFCRVKELIFPWNYEWMKDINNQVVKKLGYSGGIICTTHDLNLPSFLAKIHVMLGVSQVVSGILKHNMLWSLTQAFDVVGKSGAGEIILEEIVHLEDDVFVTKDFVESTLAMRRLRRQLRPQPFGSVMGWHYTYPFDAYKSRAIEKYKADSAIIDCPVSVSMAGWSLGRDNYELLKQHLDKFCIFWTRHWDDSIYLLHRPGCCTWIGNDGSILPLRYTPENKDQYDQSLARPIEPLYLYAGYPRALHAGKCGGLHYRGKKPGTNCSEEWAVEDFKQMIGEDVLVEHNINPETFHFIFRSNIAQSLDKCREDHFGGMHAGAKERSFYTKTMNEAKKTCIAIGDPKFRHFKYINESLSRGETVL